MRIAIPIHSFEPGGVERVALRLAERWREDGEEVVVVLGRDRGAARMSAPKLDYRTRSEPIATDWWETIWMIWSLYRFLLSEEVDAIFCPGNTYTVVCVAMKVLLGTRCPPVLVKVSNEVDRSDMPAPGRAAYGLWLRLQGIYLEHFVAIAEPMQQQIERKFDVARRKVVCIPDPALARWEFDRAATTHSKGERRPGRQFLSVGRLCPQKNQALLIDAFARCADAGDTLIIAGEGPERRRLEARIKRLDLTNRVSLPGHVDDVSALYAAADVFVLSSDYEGVPAVIIEALAAGLPIAATDCCVSMEWLVGHGRFGVLAPCRDIERLGAAMVQAARMKAPVAQMRSLAARFTLENSSRLYLREFARIASADGTAPLATSQGGLRNWAERGV
ncbi:glycosyltransferase [Croceibacterium aestuarii]|uniref:glycosyltransferase n=1 Tax=Croceibacterium aestuarii TaxID=3064139 RepID=UPI00272EB864|nr:glycosyltransferase [Croceibacterium sp. D39]